MRSVISTTVTNTVALGSGRYGSQLAIAATGAVVPGAYSATAIYAPASVGRVSIVNEGRVQGGYGRYDNDQGGGGGIGVYLAASGVLKNLGTIEGGTSGGSYYVAGVGGIGVSLAGAARLDNQGSIQGGAGSVVSTDYGQGGAGGVGVQLGAGAHGVNSGTIAGGAGGGNTYPARYGYGGVGGAGLLATAQAQFTNSGTIAGGAAGNAYIYVRNGGDGVDFSSGGRLDNRGLIVGGAGAASQIGTSSVGGVGVVFDGAGSRHPGPPCLHRRRASPARWPCRGWRWRDRPSIRRCRQCWGGAGRRKSVAQPRDDFGRRRRQWA